MKKAIVASLMGVLAAACVKAPPEVRVSPLEELMPAPRIVVAEAGVWEGEGWGDDAQCVDVPVRVVRGVVPGAPADVANEAYVLAIRPDGVTITVSDRLGILRAQTTLEQLKKLAAPNGACGVAQNAAKATGGKLGRRGGRKDAGATPKLTLPCCTITDWPALKWRGFMLDVARNYVSVPAIKKLIDEMAAYKLNLLHWHLTENYAWRLESKRYPELTKKGFFDPLNARQAGKYYTQDEFRNIVEYAYARGVTVMPEIDVPGHAQAFRVAFGFKTMQDKGVTETVANLIDEMCKLVPPEKMPMVHIGTDEVWDPHEKPSPGDCTRWAKAVTDNGQTVVSWDPGEDYACAGKRVSMLWGSKEPFAGSSGWLDARGWYIETYDPFEVLPAATYTRPFKNQTPRSEHLGAIFCAWHDAAAGNEWNVFRNQPIFPSCVLFGDMYWRGRAKDYPELGHRLPLANDARLAAAIDLERRTIAQRDKVGAGAGYPFHFVKQTDLRWRLSLADGRVLATNVVGGTINPCRWIGHPENYTDVSNGVAIAETWIKSPKDQTIGAWIGFTSYDRDHGRARSGGTPKAGEWNRFGSYVEVNGAKLAAPNWKQQNMTPGGRLPGVKWIHLIDEVPFADDEYYMREPMPVAIKKGWNHVKMVMKMPNTVKAWWSTRWVGTFVPVAGTTDHPHEVTGLEYSSELVR